jgi:hypothetical protein
MQFSPESIIMALFAGVIGALASYFAYYAKSKAELRAATEDLKTSISNQIELTRAIENEKFVKAVEGFYAKPKAELQAATEDLKNYISNQVQLTRAVEAEKLNAAETRKCVYSLVSAAHTLAHSMCWLRWDVDQRKSVRREIADLYNSEAHKAIPEILSQHLILSRLDSELYLKSADAIRSLIELDAKFGEAIVRSEGSEPNAIAQICNLFEESQVLEQQLVKAFIGNVR